MGRKIFNLCIIVLLLMTCGITVSAEGFDPQKEGSISVTLVEQNQKTPVTGAELSIYYIGTVDINTEGELIYFYTENFANTGIALDDPLLATKLDMYLSENDMAATKLCTNEEGTINCTNLPLGLYFIRQTNAVEGFAPCTPFLVTVPIKNTDGYVYEVNASPKTEAAKLTSITVKKVWNTDASVKAADSVTVQLLRHGVVMDTATLNEHNNWQVIYTDMPESDAYSIQEVNVPKGFTDTYKQTDYVFVVTNSSTLIQTGQLIWPIPVLAFIGILLIGTGSVLLQKKRKQDV